MPTPLVIPFGFFPITKTRKAGLIIPRDFEFADQEGLGLRDFGWYQPISEHLDAQVLFNAYTSGSWGTNATIRYNKRYHYLGNFLIRRNVRVTEDNRAEKVRAKSFGITWSHNQDTKAHPTRKFGGTVNIETNRDQNRNLNDYNSVYRNTLTSNINYIRARCPGRGATTSCPGARGRGCRCWRR
ncbi:MAG TPA: putative LPS assembly protein LptD [Rubrivivax sp.]|nr:putative LPS assembly protein LptD [Rubrivivax sp.]